MRERYAQGAILDDDTFFLLLNLEGRGVKTVDIPKCQLDAAENLYQERKMQAKLLSDCCDRNNKGIAFEKSGNLQKAVECYEQNIVEGQYVTRHPYDRLMVIYRRLEDYDSEIRVIRRAIEVHPSDMEYIDKLNSRLQKSQTLKNKIL